MTLKPIESPLPKFSSIQPKLMLIEDDPDMSELLARFFKQRGYKVLHYVDAERALRNLEKVEPDVVLSDLNLPNMTGIEFTERAKKIRDVPIVLITATKSVEVAVNAIGAGAYDFIVKPIHFPQLLVSIERSLFYGRMRKENEALKSAVVAKEGSGVHGVIGKSPRFLKALDLAKRVSNSTSSVLVSGESGTGKEVIARAIHSYGKRKDAPFVAINCSAIPENLLESELFGYAKGAFTGATDKKTGLFEEAEGGTIFLDEIGDLSLPLQAKLLRVLQEKTIKRLGENQARPIDVRVISATHKNLRQEIEEKRFREDLFFRLNVIPIHLPALRERKEDILPLASFFLRKYAALNSSPVRAIGKKGIERMLAYAWPGNVRELENTIERAVVLCQTDQLTESDLFETDYEAPVATDASRIGVSVGAGTGGWPLKHDGGLLTIDELTNLYVHYAVERNGGAKDRTARELGIDRKTLYRRLASTQPRNAASEVSARPSSFPRPAASSSQPMASSSG